jgi:4a-hydroxytetrahydrobiopterin dehydratase
VVAAIGWACALIGGTAGAFICGSVRAIWRSGMVDKLGTAERETALKGLNGWVYDEAASAIGHVFKFKDFSEAFAFMARVALAAEKAGHHPDWSNSYNSVTISLSTHDAGGLSAKDVALAQAIDRIVG